MLIGKGKFDASPAVAAKLTGFDLDVIERTSPTQELECQICGGVKPRGSSERMAVVEICTLGYLHLGFAHVTCRDRHGDEVVEIDEHADDENDPAALRIVIRNVRPAAVLILDLGVLAGKGKEGSILDEKKMTSFSFQPTTTSDLDRISPSQAPLWTAKLTRERFCLSHPQMHEGIPVPLNTFTARRWTAIARAEGSILVLAGTQLNIKADPILQEAIKRGGVFGAVVAVAADGGGIAKQIQRRRAKAKRRKGPRKRRT